MPSYKIISFVMAAIFAFAAIGVPVLVGMMVNNKSDEDTYEQLIAGCERNNPLRNVVFTNTENAIKQSADANDPKRTTHIFRANLRELKSVEGVDPRTGIVDCHEVVPRP